MLLFYRAVSGHNARAARFLFSLRLRAGGASPPAGSRENKTKGENRMKKSVLVLALVLCLGLLILPAGAVGADWTVENWTSQVYYGIGECAEGLTAVATWDGRDSGWGTPILTWGFIDEAGKEVIPCQYEYTGSPPKFCEGLARVNDNSSARGKWGFIDKSGKLVIPYKYDFACNFSGGLALVELNGKYGYIDTNGNEVVSCKYDYIEYDRPDENAFFDDLSMVRLDGKYGYIDKSGKEVIPCKHDIIGAFSEGLVSIRTGTYPDTKYGYINKSGSLVISCKYDSAECFSDGLAAVKLNGKYGYINKVGQEIIPYKYDWAGNFSEGLAWVMQDGKYGLIDKTGKEVIPCQYDGLGDIGPHDDNSGPLDDSMMVSMNTGDSDQWGLPICKYGLVSKSGKEIVPCKYDAIKLCGKGLATSWVVRDQKYFQEGLALVKLDGKWGFIDETGAEVIACQYDDATHFDNGLAAVKRDNQYILIDTSGIELTSFAVECDRLGGFANGILSAETDGDMRDMNGDVSLFRYTLLSITAPTLIGAGTLGQANELAWEIKNGVLTVTGALGTKDMVVAACEDEDGRFIGAAVVRPGQRSAKLPAGAAAKLLWLGEKLAPKCPCVQVGENK